MIPETRLVDLRPDGRESEGILGTTGTTGNTLPADLLKDLGSVPVCCLAGICGATAEEGVVGCVESASDWACEVVGVADPDCAATGKGTSAGTEMSETGRVCSAIVFSDVTESVLGGSSTAEFESGMGGLLLRRRKPFAGKSSSDTEYQGN